MTTHRAALFAASALFFLPSLAWSDTVGLLNEFNAGETARASEVNDNFDAVESAVDGNDALIAELRARIVELENDVGVPGPEGPEGPEGPQGEQGPQGIQGSQGVRGLQGEQGEQGETGSAGEGFSSIPHLAFITNETFDGDLGGIAGADALCQNAADNAGLGGSWEAWIASTGDIPSTPAYRFTFSPYGYELIDGRLLGGDLGDLFG